MNVGKTMFAQLMEFVPWKTFGRIIERHKGDAGVRTLGCADLFRVMAFSQLAWRESLRDIEVCLAANQAKLFHMGLKVPPARSTLSDALNQRDWHIYQSLALRLIAHARALYAQDPTALDLDASVYALDSTTIDLCLSLFDWAPFRSTKAAIKLHTLLDLRGPIPAFIHISDGKLHDVNVLDILPVEAGSFYLMDRGYVDFQRLYAMHQAGAFFVTRAKVDMDARRVYSHAADRASGVICDQRVMLNGFYSAKNYPEHLRRIRYKDPESGKRLVFLTNNTTLPALAIAALYKDRWSVGVSSQGHINQPVQVRPRPKDSSLVAWEASWSESETMKPSDNMLGKEYAQPTRSQRAVNADVASLHAYPEAERVDNARKQQEPIETSPMRRLSPAGYQRRHGEKENVATGEALGVRRRNLVEEATAITASGKCGRRRQGGGSGRTTVDGRAAKHVWREGPGPVSIPLDHVRQR